MVLLGQEVSECMSRCDELLQKGTSYDAKLALDSIDEALLISWCSEKLLQIKAEALFKVCLFLVFFNKQCGIISVE